MTLFQCWISMLNFYLTSTKYDAKSMWNQCSINVESTLIYKCWRSTWIQPIVNVGSMLSATRDLLGRSKTSLDVSVQICPCSGFGIWALVFKSTQNILICQKRIVSAGASYICTSAVRFRTDIEVHSLPDDPLLPRFLQTLLLVDDRWGGHLQCSLD